VALWCPTVLDACSALIESVHVQVVRHKISSGQSVAIKLRINQTEGLAV
jgi:hypothetical protein